MPDNVTALQVAAAVLQRPAAAVATTGRSLMTLAVRRSGGTMHGYWEFPGGKRESGESMQACLVREIEEELGLQIEVGEFLGVSRYPSPDRTIELHAYRVTEWTGEIRLSVHDKLCWLAGDELDSVNWCPADIPLLDMLRH